MSTRTNTLVFDFDGTISLGHGPVLAYANGVAASLPADRADSLLHELTTGLAAYPSGRVPGSGAIDGYALVRELALSRGANETLLSDAYLSSRERLATSDAEINAPNGLVAFLDEARRSAHLVLATNAPDVRIPEALDVLGISELFDEVHTSVGKPDGLHTILDRWLPVGRVLAIGDVWANDLEPAQRRGAATALVASADDAPDVTPDFRATHLDELYSTILDWLDPRGA